MPRRERGSPRTIQLELLQGREREQARTKLNDAARKRKAVLTASLGKHVPRGRAAVIEATERVVADRQPEMYLASAGEARVQGFELRHGRRFRMLLQETLRIPDGPPPFFVVHYSYIFVDAESGLRIFRFEYERTPPDGANRWKRSPHLHVEAMHEEIDRLHFPLCRFVEDVVDKPEEVLDRVLEWCADEFR